MQVELQLVVILLHVQAQLVEGLVVVGLFDMRQLMHHDHPQELGRGLAEHAGNADFPAGLELAAVVAGNGGMRAQRVFDHLQLAVIQHLAQRHRLAQVTLLDGLHVVVELAVVAHRIGLGVALADRFAQLARVQQLAGALLQVFGIAIQVFQRKHGPLGGTGQAAMMAASATEP